MKRGRMEAFSDGVLAIVITIMVLKLSPPKDMSLGAIKEVVPTFVAYILSYIYVGMYWANHHHLLNMVGRVNGKLLWKNLHWLFWMSLMPVSTEWAGLHPLATLPSLFYGIILLGASISYMMMQYEIMKMNHRDTQLHKKVRRDIKGKISIVLYAVAVVITPFVSVVSYIIYLAVALMWIIPDRRVEKILEECVERD